MLCRLFADSGSKRKPKNKRFAALKNIVLLFFLRNEKAAMHNAQRPFLRKNANDENVRK